MSATVRAHLHLLSRLAFILQDPQVKEAVKKQENAENILKAFERVEKERAR
jgi:PTS system nitrogen regulatory IIA component